MTYHLSQDDIIDVLARVYRCDRKDIHMWNSVESYGMNAERTVCHAEINVSVDISGRAVKKHEAD